MAFAQELLPKNDSNDTTDFCSQKRSRKTHALSADPDAPLQEELGKESDLAYFDHALVEKGSATKPAHGVDCDWLSGIERLRATPEFLESMQARFAVSHMDR